MGSIVELEDQELAGAKRGYWIFDTVNANAWGADETGGRGRGALEYLRRSHADVVGIQETRLETEAKCWAGMAAARKAKWKVKLAQADTTEKGYSSAGVAVACRAQFGVVVPSIEEVKYDSARIAHAHLGAVCRGGVHCFAVYLVTCEGMSEKNQELLRELAQLIKAVGALGLRWAIGICPLKPWRGQDGWRRSKERWCVQGCLRVENR